VGLCSLTGSSSEFPIQRWPAQPAKGGEEGIDDIVHHNRDVALPACAKGASYEIGLVSELSGRSSNTFYLFHRLSTGAG
jgi:hypothetical protein